MPIPLHKLLTVANFISCNSEPMSWEIRHTKVFFENQNDGEKFYMYLDQEPVSYSTEGYRFKLPDSSVNVELQFFTLNLITPESLHTSD